ncbi:unnamed protein product [Rhizophagus irregularis]|nr:unnamed protein product [Rhizophagus irregularis]CAB5296606.1 unnamed protein product [Rhizophagus irregularis]
MKRSWLELNWTGRLDSSAILTRGNKFLTVRLLSFISLGMGFLGLPILFGNKNVSVSCGNRGLVYVYPSDAWDFGDRIFEKCIRINLIVLQLGIDAWNLVSNVEEHWIISFSRQPAL